MESGKPRKFKIAPRQRLSYRFILATGISVVLITALLIIYFQFFQNPVSKAKSLPVLTQENLPVEMVVEEKIITTVDTLMQNGSRYRIAKPINR